MGTPVTDPQLLAQLNSEQPKRGTPVTDPALLAQLNGDAQPQEPSLPPPVQRSSPGGGMGEALHGLGLAANSILKGAGAAPAYLLDRATDPLRDTQGPGLGRDIANLGYTVQKPSDLWQQAIDKLIPATPQNSGEKVANFIGQMGGGMLGPSLGQPAGPAATPPEQTQLRQNLQLAGQNGVQVTPGEAHSGPIARAVQGIAGTKKLANKNQVMNQAAIDKLMHAEFGIPADQPFTPDVFSKLEDDATHAATQAQDTASAIQTLQRLASINWAKQAFNQSSGQWDARALTSMLDNGDPLQGNLKVIAQLGGSFPKSMALPKQGMPPTISGTHVFGAPAAILGGLLTGHPGAGVAMAATQLAPDAARVIATSPFFQNNMVNGTGALAQGMANVPLGNAFPALMQYLQQQQQPASSPYPPLRQVPQQQ